MKIQVRRARNGEWFWRIVARNGRVLASSETYVRKSGAVRSARVIDRQNCWGFEVQS